MICEIRDSLPGPLGSAGSRFLLISSFPDLPIGSSRKLPSSGICLAAFPGTCRLSGFVYQHLREGAVFRDLPANISRVEDSACGCLTESGAGSGRESCSGDA
jgi:hypothetical protein